MLASCSGWGRGGLRLCQLRLRVGQAVDCECGWVYQARPYGSGGREPEATPPGPVHRMLKEWTLLVSPFGQLRAQLPCNLTVRPLDPLSYPDADRVLVAVRGVESRTQGLNSLQVKYDEARKEMTIESDIIDPQATVEVDAPLKFDLDIKSSGSGCVKVQKIECDSCRIETDQGTSILQSVKSQNLHVQTKGGKVICLGTVYGNVNIHASNKSTVTTDKLQGSSVNICTEDGLLNAKYLYTESSFLSSAAGDITLGSVHGNITLRSKMGNITIDSSSGCLKASTQQGAIDVYVSQLGEVDLKSHEGSIVVKVPSSLQTHLQLSGQQVDVSSEVCVQEMAEAHSDDGMTVTGAIELTATHSGHICEQQNLALF